MIVGDAARMRKPRIGLPLLSGMPFWLAVVVYIVLIDIMMYVTHRAFHT